MTDRGVSTSDDLSTHASLLVRAATRQIGAWERLVSLYAPLVYRWCRHWGLQPSDAENVGQEVFARLAHAEAAVHRVAALVKRWLLGTHQGSVDEAHLPSYFNEFVFRFNRRRSRSRGLVFYRILQLAVDHDPIRYRQLVAQPEPKSTPPRPPTRRGRPPSVQRPPAQRPWRSIPAESSLTVTDNRTKSP